MNAWRLRTQFGTIVEDADGRTVCDAVTPHVAADIVRLARSHADLLAALEALEIAAWQEPALKAVASKSARAAIAKARPQD